MADRFEWKWSKDPKPEELLQLDKRTREGGLRVMKREFPHIVRHVRNRVRSQGIVVKDGREAKIPPYSEAYERRLKKEGRSTRPNYTYTGGMLDHVRGRVRVVGGDIVARAAPYGRVTSSKRIGSGKQRGKVYREPYSYTHHKTGRVVQVPGQWIRTRGLSLERQVRDALGNSGRPRKIIYNAHLMNLLVSRKGRGRWMPGRISTHNILAVTGEELASWRDRMRKGYMREAAKVLRKTAGR